MEGGISGFLGITTSRSTPSVENQPILINIGIPLAAPGRTGAIHILMSKASPVLGVVHRPQCQMRGVKVFCDFGGSRGGGSQRQGSPIVVARRLRSAWNHAAPRPQDPAECPSSRGGGCGRRAGIGTLLLQVDAGSAGLAPWQGEVEPDRLLSAAPRDSSRAREKRQHGSKGQGAEASGGTRRGGRRPPSGSTRLGAGGWGAKELSSPAPTPTSPPRPGPRRTRSLIPPPPVAPATAQTSR